MIKITTDFAIIGSKFFNNFFVPLIWFTDFKISLLFCVINPRLFLSKAMILEYFRRLIIHDNGCI